MILPAKNAYPVFSTQLSKLISAFMVSHTNSGSTWKHGNGKKGEKGEKGVEDEGVGQSSWMMGSL